jgi:putative protease
MSLTAAMDAGADAVYFGIRGYNMRANAKNFTIEDLPKITEIAHSKNVRAFLALNTILFDGEIAGMHTILKKAKNAGIDAIICWDLAVVKAAREMGHEVHLSTQASVANSEAARFYKDLGITRIVLARECTLEDVSKIKKNVGIEIETFIHGAMCVSISGRCFMSHFSTCNSANRGMCMQPCRRNYLIKDVEGEFEYEVGPNYVLSPQDLCTLPFFEKLVLSGIDCFKIEGRNKSPEYVADTTSVYRELLDIIWENKDKLEDKVFKKELVAHKARLLPKLERVFNRGFSNGFYMGMPMDAWTRSDGNVSTERKVFLGKVQNFYRKIGVAEFVIDTAESLSKEDEVLIQGPSTGNYRTTISSMETDHKPVSIAKQGGTVAIKVDKRVRRNDSVYKIEKQ